MYIISGNLRIFLLRIMCIIIYKNVYKTVHILYVHPYFSVYIYIFSINQYI